MHLDLFLLDYLVLKSKFKVCFGRKLNLKGYFYVLLIDLFGIYKIKMSFCVSIESVKKLSG